MASNAGIMARVCKDSITSYFLLFRSEKALVEENAENKALSEVKI